ncbi:MAG: glutamate--cysteine ligase [Legionellaceae bacterium]|nr:glutamate--cysteine ligase [Legionellaceae bacterium]
MTFLELPLPQITMAHDGPLFPVEEVILKSFPEIENWFRKSFENTPPPIMSSVDLRHARYKLAPVDTNLFPAGFNNLNPEFMPMCIQAAQSILSANCTNILLIPENHTRNTFYAQSLLVLRDIFMQAGFIVRLGNIDESVRTNIEMKTDDGKVLLLEPLIRTENKVGLADFDPCLVLLNNDLSAGIPEILTKLAQRVEPSLLLGWSSRFKSSHFDIYNQVASEFAELINIDPWFINPLFKIQSDVDFMLQVGIESLAAEVDELIVLIKEKYAQYNITDKPFVVIKADNGTYGMSVMMVQSGDELLAINRKNRTKMSMTKGRQKVSRVIIQEGVYSFETMNNFVSEPVIYMLGQYVVGGFYRVHRNLGVDDNLNAPGMHFEPLAFAKSCNMPSKELDVEDPPNRFYVYSVVARLAALSAAREMIVAGNIAS